jgi:hypothetical protein
MTDRSGDADEAGPLRAGASVDDILARVAQLSQGSAPKDDPGQLGDGIQPPNDDKRVAARRSAVTGRPSAADASAPRAGAPNPEQTPSWDAAEEAAAREAGPTPTASRRGISRRLEVGLATGLITILVVGAKFGLKLFAIGAVAATLTSAFGSQWDRLPSDQRQQLERRVEAAVGTSLDGLTETQRDGRIRELVSSGASRLDDASLVTWAKLDASAIAATDVGTCAIVARAEFGKQVDQSALVKAWPKAYEALSSAEYAKLAELSVTSIELEMKAAPPPVRHVDDSAIAPVFDEIGAKLSSLDAASIDELGGDGTINDADACMVLRHFEAAALQLTDADFVTWAVWVGTPS